MADHTEDNDPFEEDIVFDQAGLLGGKMPRSRQQATVGFLPTFMLFIRTVFLCIAFIGLGLCVSVSGGPLIRLEVGVDIQPSTAFQTFTARSVGMLLGGLLGSLLFDVYNRQFLMFVSLVWVAVSVTVLPFTVPVAIWWTFITTAALGMGLGFLFTGSNVLCLDLWGRQGGASLQALHFSFAVGAFIAPLVIQPFFIGLHPAEIHNLTIMQGQLTTDASALARSIRAAQTTGNVTGNEDFFSMTHEQVMELTQPKVFTDNSVPNDSSQIPLTETTINFDKKTSDVTFPLTTATTTTTPPTTTTAAAAAAVTSAVNESLKSTMRPPKKKPPFTDGNGLKPEETQVWKRPSAKQVEKPKVPVNATAQSSTEIPSGQQKPDSDLSIVHNTSVIVPVVTEGGNAGSDNVNSDNVGHHLSDVDPGQKNENVSTDSTVSEVPQAEQRKTENMSVESTGDISKPASVTEASITSLPKTDIAEISDPTIPPTTVILSNTSTKPQTTTTTTTTTSTTTTTAAPVTTTPSTTTITATTTPPSLLMISATTITKPFNASSKSSIAPETTVGHISSYIDSHKTGNTANKDSELEMSSEAQFSIESMMEHMNNKDTSNVGESSVENSSEVISKDDELIPEPEVLDLKESVTEEQQQQEHEGENDDDDISGEESKSGMNPHSNKPGTYSNDSNDSIENNQFLDNMAQRFKDYGVTKVHLAYICIGIFIILNALISVVILCHNPREPRSKQDDGTLNEIHKGRVMMFTVVFSVFMFMAEALQGAVHHLLASTSTSTGLSIIQEAGIDGQVLFWGLVCLVRFICIMVSGCLRLKPGKLLTISVLFSLIGSVFLAVGSFDKEDFLWGGIIFLALGLAPILPTSFLWMAQYMRVTHRMCALMIVLASFGNSITHTLLTGVSGNSHLYAYILISISFVSLLFLLVSMCAIYTAQQSKTLAAPVGYQLASQHEEEDSIELTPSGSAVFAPNDPRLRENGEAGQSLLID